MAEPHERVAARAIRSAVVLSIGSELTTGETVDTNARELAADLTNAGVEVRELRALPDELERVTDAFGRGLGTADLVVSTGGVGPTPDDLTREAIALVCGETPSVDPALAQWLAELFARRGLTMAEMNRKQAWLIPSATAVPNPNGTAPGWWVERADGRLIVALPGPPREMRPMWHDHVLPRLRQRGLGTDTWVRTLHLAGIGESAAAEIIGEEVLRASNPQVATYARIASVDVRIAAHAEAGESAQTLGARVADELEQRLHEHVFARDDETWSDAIAARLRGRTVAILETGTNGQVAALLGGAEWLLFAEYLGDRSALAREHDTPEPLARRVRDLAGADIGMAVSARERKGDTAVTVVVATADEVVKETRTAFLGGPEGKRRAALVAAAVLWKRLGAS